MLERLGYITKLKKWFAFPLYPETQEMLIKYLKAKTNVITIQNSQFYNDILEKTQKKYHKHSRGYSSHNLKELLRRSELRFLEIVINTLLMYDKERRKVIEYSDVVTASDIQQYSFCPASYIIHKSYDIIPTWAMSFGTKNHEKTRLINRILSNEGTQKQVKDEHYINEKNRHFFNDVNNSKIIYIGHADNSKWFTNKKYRGQPDYIFKNSEGKYFVVEEKFRLRKWNSNEGLYEANDFFYRSYQMQLASYVYGVRDLDINDIQYGYLLYWNYDIDEESLSIEDCQVWKMNKDIELLDELKKTYLNIKITKDIANRNNKILFDTAQLKATKCSKCSVAAICGHKSGSFSDITLPYYQGDYNKVKDLELPNGLNKYKTAIDNYFTKYPCQVCRKWFEKSQTRSAYIKYTGSYSKSADEYQSEHFLSGYLFEVVHNINDYDSSKVVNIERITPEGFDLEENLIILDSICDECLSKKQFHFSRY